MQEIAGRHPGGLVQRRDSSSSGKPPVNKSAPTLRDHVAQPPAAGSHLSLAKPEPSDGQAGQRESHPDTGSRTRPQESSTVAGNSSLFPRKSAKKVKMKKGRNFASISAGSIKPDLLSCEEGKSRAPAKKRRVTITPVKCRSATDQLKERPCLEGYRIY